MKKEPKNKNYFTQDTEDAIILYNESDDLNFKNKIYKERIKYPFEKLAENIYNTFKFSYFDIPDIDVQSEVVSVLVEKLFMYKKENGKAFSYFSIVAKNYLIFENNKNYKRYKNTLLISEMPESWNPENDFKDSQIDNDYCEFTKLMIKYWDINLTKIFNKKRDIQIADAVLELFRRSRNIENYNKKHLYLLIREMTDCKTHYITKVVGEMKKTQIKLLNEYLDTGYITNTPYSFFNE